MKNADMPAMPLSRLIDTQGDADFETGGGRFLPANGITKLEYFALKIHCATISHHGKACFDDSFNEANRFLKEFEG